MSINTKQFINQVLRPTLKYLDPEIPYSLAAENLVLGTVMHESRLEYLKQVGRGPALGIIQMEPATHDDIWENYLKYKPEISDKLHRLETSAKLTEGAYELIGNMYYAVAMCRVFYRRLPFKLPEPDDIWAMARIWKRYYNTSLGKGTVEQFFSHFPSI